MAHALLLPSLVRSLTSTTILVLLAFMVAACRSGVIGIRPMGDGGVATMPAADGGPGISARAFFEASVEPMLVARCGGCHGPGRTGPDFLRPDPDVRTTLLSFPLLVDLESPRTSRLVTKGEHSGPALTPEEASLVVQWIELEAAEGTMLMPRERELATTPVELREGFNALPLDALGLPGTSVHFVAARVADGMFLDSVQVAAGPTGARLEHPVFVVWIDGAPTPDPVDRFAGMELEVEPNSTSSFDTGSVVLTSYPEGALLSIHFDAVGPLMPSAPGPGTDGGMPDAGMPMPTTDGCTQLGAFRALVSPALGTYCTRCHGGGNPSATAALDMTRVRATDDAELLLGCNQILGRISPEAPSASGLFVQPDPAAGGGHPFKFGTMRELDTFRTNVLAWFEMEAM